MLHDNVSDSLADGLRIMLGQILCILRHAKHVDPRVPVGVHVDDRATLDAVTCYKQRLNRLSVKYRIDQATCRLLRPSEKA